MSHNLNLRCLHCIVILQNMSKICKQNNLKLHRSIYLHLTGRSELSVIQDDTIYHFRARMIEFERYAINEHFRLFVVSWINSQNIAWIGSIIHNEAWPNTMFWCNSSEDRSWLVQVLIRVNNDYNISSMTYNQRNELHGSMPCCFLGSGELSGFLAHTMKWQANKRPLVTMIIQAKQCRVLVTTGQTHPREWCPKTFIWLWFIWNMKFILIPIPIHTESAFTML